MKEPLPNKHRTAFTLIELLVLLGTLAILAALLYPGFVNAKQKAQRIRCTSYLKQIGLGFRLWAGDHTNLNPA